MDTSKASKGTVLDITNKLFNIIVDNKGFIQEITPWHSQFTKYLDKKIDALWDNKPDYFCNIIVSEVNTVMQNEKAKILPLQSGCLPAYNSEVKYWECSFYPIMSKKNVDVLIKLEDVTSFIYMKKRIEAITKNFMRPFKDRDDLKIANRDLKFNEYNYQLLLENIMDYSIFMLCERGLIRSWHIGAQSMTQFKMEDILGKHYSILYTKKDQTKHQPQEQLSLTVKNGRFEDEGWRVKKDGSIFWAHCILNPIYNDNVLIGFVVITRDLTKREELEKLKREFISMINHELITPVTVIKGSLNLLVDPKLSLSPLRKKKLIASCNNNCDRLNRLIENLLDLKQLNDSKLILNFKSINLKKLIEVAMGLNEFFSDKYNISIVAEGLEDVYILGDADRIIQVLTNLVHNAIKFSPKNATVTIKMRKNSRDVFVEVVDQGVGIPKKFKPYIFKDFMQMDSSSTRTYEGAGLGLSISRAIIEKHHGILDFKSELNRGSTFFFQLPICNQVV